MKKRMLVLFATGFGLGYSPIAPGTTGSLLGVGLVLVLCGLPLPWQIISSAVLTLAAFPVCNAAEKHFGTKDDRRIVADEYLTFPLCVLGIPWVAHPWLLAAAFVVNRVLDIVKPPPARGAQNLAGGAGIVLDDVVSSLYALCISHLIWWLCCR